MEISEHIVRSRLRGYVVRLLFRVNIQAIGQEVQVKVSQVGFTLLRVFTELLTVEALKVIDRRAEVKVDFGKNVTIAVFLNVLQSKLFNKCLLAVKIANLAL